MSVSMRGYNSLRLYFSLMFLYNVFPLLLEKYYFSSEFYIFSGAEVYYDVVTFFVMICFSFILAFAFNQPSRKLAHFSELTSQLLLVCFFVFSLQLFCLAVFGVKVRFLDGASRNELLALQHVFLVSGSSFIFLGAFAYATVFLNKRNFGILLLILVLLDVIYLGKKFTFYAIGVGLFRVDLFSVKDSNKPFIIAGLSAVFFVVLTFIVRAIYAGDDGNGSAIFDVGVYALSSEFLGVYSSIGWADLFSGQSQNMWDVDRTLSKNYFHATGHGLAIHPLAYFKFVFGDNDLLPIVYYFTLFILTVRVFSYFIGNFIYLIVSVNIMHLTRHGPDIFIKQILMQSIFLLIIFLFSELFKKRKIHSNFKVEH